MKDMLVEIFTWWNSQTVGTRFFTWRKGILVGEDDQGNRYYKERDGNRRWVIYNGPVEASRIPPGWHGWMHYRTDLPPSDQKYEPRDWQEPHEPNLTGTAGAYRPKGSILTPEDRPQVTGDYEPWSP